MELFKHEQNIYIVNKICINNNNTRELSSHPGNKINLNEKCIISALK